MSIVSRVIDKAYVQRAEAQIRDEHAQWMRTAQLNTEYWTLAPIHPHRRDMGWTYDIHGGPYEFTKTTTSVFGIPALGGNGTNSWILWQHHGPLTPVPQQTTASWHARHARSHDLAMQQAERTVDQQVIAELRRRYPHSTRALAGV